MSARHDSIAARRRILIGEIARQRHSLGQEVQSWAAPLALADQGLDVLRYARRHPLLVAGAATLLFALRPGARGGTWFGRGLLAWQMFNKFSRPRAAIVRQRKGSQLPGEPWLQRT
ncbi:MAG: YqjK-like family protein [Haliea sp.]